MDRYVSKPRFLNEGQAERWADKMIKEPKFIRETQGVFGRRVYIIRPKKELIDHILEIDPACKDDIDYFSMPTVVMTEEVSFEGDLEGWRSYIEDKCKEAYLRENIEDFPLSVMEKPEALLKDMNILKRFFDKWWITEEADDWIEILKDSWKTNKCFGNLDE